MINKCIACHNKTKLFCKLPRKFYIFDIKEIPEYILYSYCPACGTIQQNPITSPKQLSKLVEKEYSNNTNKLIFNKKESDSHLPQHKVVVNTLKRYTINKDVLDVGAGTGNLCSMLLDKRVKCTGIDLSAKLVAYAKKRGLPIMQKNLKDIHSYRSYSAIIMTHVFEHLADSENTLKHINRLLKTKGLFISVQPTAAMTNFLSRILRLNNLNSESPFSLAYLNLQPWHIIIYSIQGMEIMANRLGFKLIEVIPMPSVKNPGLIGFVRVCYNLFNKTGEKIFPQKWPFHVAHLFVFQKR